MSRARGAIYGLRMTVSSPHHLVLASASQVRAQLDALRLAAAEAAEAQELEISSLRDQLRDQIEIASESSAEVASLKEQLRSAVSTTPAASSMREVGGTPGLMTTPHARVVAPATPATSTHGDEVQPASCPLHVYSRPRRVWRPTRRRLPALAHRRPRPCSPPRPGASHLPGGSRARVGRARAGARGATPHGAGGGPARSQESGDRRARRTGASSIPPLMGFAPSPNPHFLLALMLARSSPSCRRWCSSKSLPARRSCALHERGTTPWQRSYRHSDASQSSRRTSPPTCSRRALPSRERERARSLLTDCPLKCSADHSPSLLILNAH